MWAFLTQKAFRVHPVEFGPRPGVPEGVATTPTVRSYVILLSLTSAPTLCVKMLQSLLKDCLALEGEALT